ncbi:hypothetical protein K439DRAFT_1626908 [Ramaria rubella]|nr:hypothetical protein K439DRAFT_1626908 [Ramaria rubella]
MRTQKYDKHPTQSILLLVWLILSSCLGLPILHAFSGFWEAALAGARTRGIGGAMARRRRELGGYEIEDWEMEHRNRLI